MLFEKILAEEHQGEAQCELRVSRSKGNISSKSPLHESTHSNSAIPPIKMSIAEDSDLIICDFCRADIFQSYFECRQCGASQKDDGERFIICPHCYIEGRSCKCTFMLPVQNFPMEILFEAQRQAHSLLQFKAYPREKTGTGVALYQRWVRYTVEALNE